MTGKRTSDRPELTSGVKSLVKKRSASRRRLAMAMKMWNDVSLQG